MSPTPQVTSKYIDGERKKTDSPGEQNQLKSRDHFVPCRVYSVIKGCKNMSEIPALLLLFVFAGL